MSKNKSSIAFSTNTQVQRRDATKTSNSSDDMMFQVPIKFWKQNSSSNGNTKTLTSFSRFENLRLPDNFNNMSFQIKKTENPPFIWNPVLVPHESVRMRNQIISVIRLLLVIVEDHLSVQPKNVYKITSLNKEWLLELHHMQVQRNLKMKRYV